MWKAALAKQRNFLSYSHRNMPASAFARGHWLIDSCIGFSLGQDTPNFTKLVAGSMHLVNLSGRYASASASAISFRVFSTP